MIINYIDIKQDFEYLNSLSELEDASEVESMVWDLMEMPIKSRAAELYFIAVKRWFHENKLKDFEGDILVEEIYDRYFR